MATILCTLATIISCPSKFIPTFTQFPQFRILHNSDDTLTFEDPKTGKWFINTTAVTSPISCVNGVFTAKTRNSIYSWRDNSTESPNTFYKVSFVDYELHEEKPDWAREARQISDGSWVIKTYNNSFHTTKEKADERANYLLHVYDGPNSEEVRAAKEMGCIKLNGVFKVVFDDEFINAVERWSKRINSYGEFAFSLRRRDRQQMRQELAPATLDKIERRNRLDYMREFA